MSLSTCQRRVTKFNDGDFDVTDAKRSGRPSLTIDEEILNFMEEDKYATTRQMAEEFGVATETIRLKLHRMGKKYLVNIWVPHRLTEVNKLCRKTICQKLLAMHRNNDFLMRLITVDEVWVYWKTDERSYHNRSWVTPGGDGVTSVMRSSMTNKKHMASVFWDARGIIFVDVLPAGVHITSQVYCEQLDKLKEAVYEKRRRTQLSDYFFLQDNARPHTAFATMDKLEELHLNLIEHPPYSPDLSPSDYYLFSPMKNAIRGRNYENAGDVMKDIQNWFDSKDRGFYSKAFNLLPERWQKCIDANGDYFQHLSDID